MSDLSALWDAFANAIISLLPLSPFTAFFESWVAPPWLGWLNWFFPVQFCVNVLLAWTGAIAVYYLYSIIMRWVKMIA